MKRGSILHKRVLRKYCVRPAARIPGMMTLFPPQGLWI